MSTTVSSSTSTSTSSYSSSNRVTGLVSGLDVDSIVSSLMTAEKQPLYKLQQEKQLAEWRQDAYREVSNELRAFSDKYLNYSSSSTNMLSQSTYQQFSTTSSDDSVLTISANSDAVAGSHTVVVNQLATAASYSSNTGITAAIKGSNALTSSSYSSLAGKSFALTVDGVKSTITLGSSVTGLSDIQNAINTAVGSGKITVSSSNGDGTGLITFSKVSGSGIGTVAVSEGSGALSALGFDTAADNLKNYLSTTSTLEDVSSSLGTAFSFDSSDNINIKINDVSFKFSKTTTLKEMISEINSSDAGVTMKYNSSSDSFSITANDTGAGNKISMSETGSTFLSTTGLNSSSNYTAGKDASVTIDGETLVRSTNSITQDGVTYKLKDKSTETQTVSVSQDTDTVYDTIKSFVDDYNTLIDSINSKISEEYDRDYPPLTDDQKEQMSDSEITSWEEKAKTGLLEKDSVIQSLLSNMRSALYQSVSGVSAHLTEIGITTSSNYEDKGKLEIDESKLKTAIESNPEDVMNLFSKQSDTYSGTATVRNLTSSQRTVRTSEEGLAYKLYDILQDNISTYTGISGNKGLLIEKAGLADDGSEYDNTISDQISKYDEEITALTDKLSDKEDYYYKKYSTMETYINQMNSQLTSLQSMLG